ncbi:MAG: glycosyltransferase family 2 protein [Mediterranea massiliensis]|nr:glycosyltransferase family 2 protein [Mediterranea massiliensis]
MKPLVTLYIVSYQKFEFYKRAIDSVLIQDYDNIELILSDDGSDNYPIDDVLMWVSKHSANIKSVTILDNPKNVGTVRHVNNILKLAKGELFMPLAADDQLFDSNVVSKVVEHYNKSPFNVLSTSRICINENDDFVCYLPHITDRKYIYKRMKTAKQQFLRLTENRAYDFASGSSMIYKTEFLKALGGFDERYILWEDGPFLNKMSRCGYPIDFGYDIFYIKYHTGGISSNKNYLLIKDELLYNTSERLYEANDNGIFHKRIVTFWSFIGLKKHKIVRLLYYILYPEVIISRIITIIRNKRGTNFDVKHFCIYNNDK